MSNYVFQVWDEIEHKMVAVFDTHNKAKKEAERLIDERDFWDEVCYVVKKVNLNKVDKQ